MAIIKFGSESTYANPEDPVLGSHRCPPPLGPPLAGYDPQYIVWCDFLKYPVLSQLNLKPGLNLSFPCHTNETDFGFQGEKASNWMHFVLALGDTMF